MKTIFGFPQRYEVRKKLDKERFLKFGNLSPAETRRIEAYLDKIEIIYSIPYYDKSEMTVLVANCPAPTEYSDIHHQYGILNFANAIAASIPYHCLVMVRAGSVFKLFMFSKHDHRQSIGRTVIDETYSTPEIYQCELGFRENVLFASMSDAIKIANNADDLNGRWIVLLANYSGGYNQTRWCASDPFSAYHYQILLENNAKADIENRIVEGNLGEDYLDFVDSEAGHFESWLPEFNYNEMSDLYEGYSLDPDGDAIHRSFMDFCCEICRAVYNAFVPEEYQNEDAEVQWLKNYIKACNSYAYTEFNAALDSRCVQMICSAFHDGDVYPIDVDNPDFSVDYMVEYLSGFYYDAEWNTERYIDDYEDDE